MQLASHRSEGLRVLIGFLLDFWRAANASGIRYSRGYFRFWPNRDICCGCTKAIGIGEKRTSRTIWEYVS